MATRSSSKPVPGTRYELMIDTLAIDFRAPRQICCRRHL
jgi:hypothetical protein